MKPIFAKMLDGSILKRGDEGFIFLSADEIKDII
ncbi:hypothetical protein S100141_04888 (plasmid) [Bacillus licheniformis]|nr:hypothetical protein S100141_04888 [Bacillus licheniformis]